MTIVLEVLLFCELRSLTSHFQQQTSAKILWGLYHLRAKYLPMSLQLKHDFSVFYFYPTLVIQNFSVTVYIVLLHSTVGVGFFE
jgi:hypothetical protein